MQSTSRIMDNIVPKTGIGRGPFTPNFLNIPKCHVENLEQIQQHSITQC